MFVLVKTEDFEKLFEYFHPSQNLLSCPNSKIIENNITMHII